MNFRLFLFFFLLNFSAFAQKSYYIDDNLKYTNDLINQDLYKINSEFQPFVQLDTIGFSEFGLPILTLKIHSESTFKKYPIWLVGNIHAREDYSSKMVMKFANLFLLSVVGMDSTYEKASQYLELFDIYISPVVNPDGLKIAHEDWSGIEKFKDSVLKIKRIDGLSAWKANGLGVDLNSNFDDGNHLYKCTSISQEVPASEGYKGCYPAEAKETIVLQNFANELNPILTLSFHTKGNVLFWGDCDTYEKFNNVDSLISGKVARMTGLKMMNLSYNPISYGCGLENYIRAKLGMLAVCVELSPMTSRREQHPDNQFNKLVWSKVAQLPIIYLQELLKTRELWPTQMQDYFVE
jgi:g-D-glutamyl-meso-diaminopimelate peptidase